MKILFVATVSRHILTFHTPYLKWFSEQGWEVHVAASGDLSIPYCHKMHIIPIHRSPFELENIKAYLQFKKIVRLEKYDIIHGHTPLGGMFARFAGRTSKARVIYTSHGFHFYKGGPLKNWILYYTIEKWLSRYTDDLITINHEDFAMAKTHMKAKKLHYVPGVGVDCEKFSKSPNNRDDMREALGIPKDVVVILSIGELNINKNHQIVIKALALLDKPIFYVICGQGNQEAPLRALASSLGVGERLILSGYRTDIADFLHMSDIFIFPSKREGLPVSLMEAMAAGLPCIVSNIRGNTDLIEHGKGGAVCEVDNALAYADAIEMVIGDKNNMGKYNQIVVKGFDISTVIEQMKGIYNEE